MKLLFRIEWVKSDGTKMESMGEKIRVRASFKPPTSPRNSRIVYTVLLWIKCLIEPLKTKVKPKLGTSCTHSIP